MDKKVVFLDVDGTLVNKEGIIPASAQEAIHKAQANGHKMVVCTGRSLFQVPQMLINLGFSGIIAAAGAHVIADGKEIFHATIDEEHRKMVSDYLQRNKFVFCFQTDDGIVASEENRKKLLDNLMDMGVTENYMAQIVGEFHICDDVWKNDREEKVIYYDAPFPVERVNADLQPYFDTVQLSLAGADDYCGEIGINGIHKATGMQTYLDYVDISRENTIAIGDGPNDFQMLEYAKVGVAMGNAKDEVKERANMVTDDINENGIYNAFQKLGLI